MNWLEIAVSAEELGYHTAWLPDHVLPPEEYGPWAQARHQAVFAAVRAVPRILFVGRSTPHRESFLGRTKGEFDVLHIAFGVGAAELDEVMRTHDVAINLHNEPYPSFENRVCLHLAAGHLVISETLSPTHGLEPGIRAPARRRPIPAQGLNRHPVADEGHARARRNA